MRRRKGLRFDRRRKKMNVPLMKEIVIWTIEIMLAVGVAYVFVYFFGLRTSVVGQSMAETLDSGEQVLVDRFIYKISSPKANDVIVFLPNGNEKSHYYVKRVIGVPGDTVQIIDGQVYVNGEVFDEEIEAVTIKNAGLAAEVITLQSGEYFVLGDNRNNSEDSRYANIGNIDEEYILGKAWFDASFSGHFGLVE